MAFQRTYDPNVPDDAMIPVGARRPMKTDAGRRTPDAGPEKTDDRRRTTDDRPGVAAAAMPGRPEKPDEEKEQYATLAEVQAVINSLVDSIKSGFVTKADHLAVVSNLNRYIAVLQSKIPSEIDIKATARKQIPTCLRDLEQAGRQGNVLMLEPGGTDGGGTDKDSAYWGTVKAGGLTAEGDQVLYKGVFLREYDAAGVIVAPGSDINPADYATQELYDAALTAAGHTLKPTWDWMRAAWDITP